MIPHEVQTPHHHHTLSFTGLFCLWAGGTHLNPLGVPLWVCYHTIVLLENILKRAKKPTCTLPLRDQYFSNLSIDICDDRKSQGLI